MKYALAFAAASAFALSAAVAGHKEHGDGQKVDWDAKVESHFKEVDANADGAVTEAELVAYMTAKAKTDFAAMAGGDASVTLVEAKAYHKAKHDEMKKEHEADKTE